MTVWTNPATPVTLTPITVSFYNVNVRDDLIYLRGLVPDAPAAGRALMSTGPSSAAFNLIPVNAATPLAATFASLLGANKSGLYEVTNAGDGPEASRSYYVMNIVESGSPASFAGQFALDATDPTDVYVRIVSAGTPTAWQKVWHAGNDGAGSGLDADLLDGLDSGAFATAGHTHAAGSVIPSGLVAAFRTGAELTAAGAHWARETPLDGTFMIGAGTNGGRTFVETIGYGTAWVQTVGSGNPSPPGGAVQGGGSSTAAPAPHTHTVSVDITPPSRAYIYSRYT